MSCYARALVSLLVACFATWGSTGCTLGPSGDYQVAVSWLINGTTPTADLCAEQRIARFRFEVRTGGGRVLKTHEADCASTTRLGDGFEYGGYLSSAFFEWETEYFYTLTPVDASGNALSDSAESSFSLYYGEGDIYDLVPLDFLQPVGSVASLAGEWSIGSNLVDDLVSACARRGIKTVRMMASSGLDKELLDAVQLGEAPCGDGKFASGTNVLARGSYNFFYEAVSTGDSTVAISEATQILVADAKPVVVPRAIFPN